MEMTSLEETFAFRGRALGARPFKLQNPGEQLETSPNWAVLFPSGYVEFLIVADETDTITLTAKALRSYQTVHHPIRLIHDEREAMRYWDKVRRHCNPGFSWV